jgi:SPP1 family predicted phage head-tail adaptor
MIGNLNKRVALLQKVQTAGGGGGFTEGWQSAATVWANLKAQSGSETYTADKMQTKAKYEIRMRTRSGPAAGWRVGFKTRTFDVVAVQDEDTATLLLICEEIP